MNNNLEDENVNLTQVGLEDLLETEHPPCRNILSKSEVYSLMGAMENADRLVADIEKEFNKEK